MNRYEPRFIFVPFGVSFLESRWRTQVDSLQEVDAEEEIEESSRAKKKNEKRPVIDKENQRKARKNV